MGKGLEQGVNLQIQKEKVKKWCQKKNKKIRKKCKFQFSSAKLCPLKNNLNNFTFFCMGIKLCIGEANMQRLQ